MTTTRKRWGLLAIPILALAMGCRSYIPTVRKESFEAVEVILPDPAEAQAMAARLGKRLGVPVYEARLGTARVLRLQPKIGERGSWGGSLTKTLVMHAGFGALIGLTAPGWGGFWIPTTPVTFEALAAAGLVVGTGVGAYAFRANQEQFRELGYYPATCVFLDTQVVIHGDTGGYGTIIKFPRMALDVRPYLKPLPLEARTPAEIRKVSLVAYTDALGDYLVTNAISARMP